MSQASGGPSATPGGRGRLRGFLSRRSAFTRNVAKLSSGTIARTLLAFGTMPLVTRLYAPEHFGDLQLLLSVIGTFLAVSTLKYELAIVLPQDREESRRASVLCLVVVALLGACIGLLCFAFGGWFLALFDAERLEPWVGLVVVGFLAGGVLRTTHYVLVARQQFGSLARNNVIQVGCTQAGYIGLGLWRPSFLGLFASQMSGHLVAIFFALRRARIPLRGCTARQLLALASRYRKFPLVNTPGVFVNSLAYEMPVFLLARHFDADVVGFYMLTDRLLNQPTALIGEAIAKVYLQSAAEAWPRGPRVLRSLFRRTAGRLLLVSVPFALAVALAAPWVTQVVLGDPYREVGVMMQILVVGRFLSFVSSPLFTTFSVVDRQEIGVALMAVSSAARVVAMLAFTASSHHMLMALAATIGLFALIYLFAVDRVLSRLPEPTPGAVGRGTAL